MQSRARRPHDAAASLARGITRVWYNELVFACEDARQELADAAARWPREGTVESYSALRHARLVAAQSELALRDASLALRDSATAAC